MTRIAHITDLHFGAADPTVVAALLAELNADPPDLVAISGDLTQGARRSEFHEARAFIDALTAPSLAVPGNHDISPYNLVERFTDPYRRWRALVGPQTEPEWRDDQVAVIGLNTARRMGAHWDWSRGSVSRSRLARLVRRLDAVPPGLARIVVAHHPLLPPEAAPDTRVAGHAAAALAEFARLGVALVLAGHLHRGYARIAAPGGRPLVLHGATATSTRLRGEPNAYHRIRIGADGRPDIEVRAWTPGQGWAAAPAAPLTTSSPSPATSSRAG